MNLEEVYNTNKLLKHLGRVEMWDKEGATYPIVVDFDLTDKCNNYCPQCVTHTIQNQATVAIEDAKSILMQFKDMNVKLISVAGGGDPSCHPHYGEILRFIKQQGMEVATQTNGYELSDKVIDAIVNSCIWMRVSLDADGPEMYKLTHGMKEKAFNQVLENIVKLSAAKKNSNSNIVLGTTYLLGPHTLSGIYGAAKLSKELGVDGIRFRTFHKLKKNFTEEDVERMFGELERSKELKDEQFFVSYSHRCEGGFGQTERKRNFGLCYFPHFMTAMTAQRKLYSCCLVFKGLEKYCIGDLKQKSFREIWFSEERKQAYKNIDLRDCPNPCTFEKYAEFLWNVKQPMLHSNSL